MRVEDRVLKNVVFVGIETNGIFTPLGTGFLVCVAAGDLSSNYLVTADHVVDLISEDAIFVRVNRPVGDRATIRIPKARVRRHSNSKNDIAIFLFPLDRSVTDHVLLPMDRAHLDSSREVWGPGIGDEVVAIGLYTSHYGEIRNRPVARIGNIAAMPEEPVRTDAGYVTAYLVEIRSIGGLSGSPVYLNVPQFRIQDGEIQTRDSPRYQPIGMLIGYHFIETQEDQIVVPQFQNDEAAEDHEGDRPGKLNTGFGVVIPIERVIEILESDDEKARIKRGLEARAQLTNFVRVAGEAVTMARRRRDENRK